MCVYFTLVVILKLTTRNLNLEPLTTELLLFFTC